MADASTSSIPEDMSRLKVFDYDAQGIDIGPVTDSLQQDSPVLIKGVESQKADDIIHDVAERFSLSDALKLQAGFAAFRGHRHNIGKFFMSVNNREEYQFIPPHSEGTSSIGMQLASFYCYENSSDGGETIIMNVDDSSDIWQSLRELVKRVRIGSTQLTTRDISRARGMYQVQIPGDVVKDDDLVLGEQKTEIPGLTLISALAKPIRTRSRILGRDVYSYWDTTASIDFDSAEEYAKMLKSCGLLKEPPGGAELRQMDNAADRRIWRSGVAYARLFRCKITRKLAPGDLIIQNNLTWTHAASNWSPRSGTRNIAASFA